ncbi:MAG: ion transporter [Acidobacteria bacterium]|jgi:voltage-gated potassium channel|nr:ion transporter [Acidobacteriota bacterium]
MNKIEQEYPGTPLRDRLHEIIFEADTRAGKIFDLVLLWLIITSVAVVILESVKSLGEEYGEAFYYFEWIFTVFFTLEYILRLLSVRRPLRYAFSFFGIIDLLAIIPGYLRLLIPGTHYLLTIRILRLLRIFRILKLTEYIMEAGVITSALRASRRKISVFILAVLAIVTVVGSLIYVIEGEENGFTDIPTSIYWAIVTLTTVGYGDLSPKTALGKMLSSIVMILGYAIIAVPTGIVTAELTRANRKYSTQVCPECHSQDHDADAVFCKYCGAHL